MDIPVPMHVRQEVFFVFCLFGFVFVFFYAKSFHEDFAWFDLLSVLISVNMKIILIALGILVINGCLGGKEIPGLLSPKSCVDVPAGPQKYDFLIYIVPPNYPLINIPFSVEKQTILPKLGTFAIIAQNMCTQFIPWHISLGSLHENVLLNSPLLQWTIDGK